MRPELFKFLTEQGPIAVLMGIAIWYFHQRAENAAEKRDKANERLITALNKERTSRIDAMEAHIVECDTDRKWLRNMIFGLKTGVTLPVMARADHEDPNAPQ